MKISACMALSRLGNILYALSHLILPVTLESRQEIDSEALHILELNSDSSILF